MKITSCDCFEKFIVINPNDRIVDLTYPTDSDEVLFPVLCLNIRNHNKVEHVAFVAKYCPFCGKKIEVNNGIMHNLVKIVFKDESSSFLRDVNDEELQKSLKEKGWHEFSDGQMVNMDEIREIIPIRTGD